MFDPNNVSKTELQFIRTYVAAMKRDYHLLWSVLDLMNPDALGVKEIVVAARTAQALQEMQADFDSELVALQKKHRLAPKGFGPATPTTAQLAELFTLSFFKVVTTTPKGKKKDDGWFSGEPDSWKDMMQSMQTIDVNKLPQMLSSYIATLIKLFKPFSSGFFPLEDTPVNYHWNLPGGSFGFKNNIPEYDDDEYFDDDEENPFDDDQD
jgi:hypothetical protein